MKALISKQFPATRAYRSNSECISKRPPAKILHETTPSFISKRLPDALRINSECISKRFPAKNPPRNNLKSDFIRVCISKRFPATRALSNQLRVHIETVSRHIFHETFDKRGVNGAERKHILRIGFRPRAIEADESEA